MGCNCTKKTTPTVYIWRGPGGESATYKSKTEVIAKIARSGGTYSTR